ncbi:low molecular weight phosphotyrosine protein phosphatase [Streptomonospora sp. PA3]|uniref:low molecular weight protein-tyrosine-phosphatase n=1 Tax=Streptomonospora sp. PA3 TaxID=2607326 RepID=UPI0012DCCD40|nr:low molecular weight protein-tyrosine-phosphatase [Streptomonospora sp. PA3]MUL42241.1 low molecular weight phosphotyrosine protein phosphatase [Streptomonospora sp. PA3]
MSLPDPLDPAGPYRIALVCLGNICRSPMAEKVLAGDLARAGLAGTVVVDSSGTGSWHIGSGMDPRAAAALRLHGFPTNHTARRFDAAWFAERDLILAMDLDNLEELVQLAPDPAAVGDRLRLFRSFAPGGGGGPNPEVPDPYYGGDDGFSTVLSMLEAASKGLTAELAARFGPQAAR